MNREAHILICVDSFKGSLSSMQVAAACHKGVSDVMPDAVVREFPLADGGEGTVDAIREAIHGTVRTVTVDGPLGELVQASYLVSADASTAFIEMAAAAGLPLVPQNMRNPMLTSTFGVGQLIADAYDAGCRRFLIGIGGSATNDGGTGMLQALGFRFLDSQGNELGRGGQILEKISTIKVPEHCLDGAEFTVMCDVDNPLTGPSGAAYVFAPQKGADAVMVSQLDKGLANYAAVIRSQGFEDVEHFPGAGAAGGLGAAFKAFLNARLCRGVELILELTGFEKALAGADLVITGEGSIDSQTLHGKAPAGVLEAARRHNVPVIAIAGNVRAVEQLNRAGFVAVLPVVPGVCTLQQAMEPHTAFNNVKRTVEQALRLLKYNL